jgi:hypothetical protein
MNWKKSTFSSNGVDCVEIATTSDAALIRNSQHPDRGALTLPSPVLAAFVAACRAGELDDLTA